MSLRIDFGFSWLGLVGGSVVGKGGFGLGDSVVLPGENMFLYWT